MTKKRELIKIVDPKMQIWKDESGFYWSDLFYPEVAPIYSPYFATLEECEEDVKLVLFYAVDLTGEHLC